MIRVTGVATVSDSKKILMTHPQNPILMPWSLKLRVTLLTVAIFVAGMWSLSFYLEQTLREDMQQLLIEQQISAVHLVAAQINNEVNQRLTGLQIVAKSISPALIRNAAALQDAIEKEQVLLEQFNWGLFVVGIDGVAIASTPASANRVGNKYIDRDHVVRAIRDGNSNVGRPVISKTSGAPVVAMAVPIRDADQKIIGAIIGSIDLGKPSVLDKLSESRIGKTGSLLLIDREYRQIITTADKSRVMEILPAPGVTPLVDGFIKGEQGAGIFVNPHGVEVLGTAKDIPAAGWLVVAKLPTHEAFEPIRAIHQRILWSTIGLTILIGMLTWWMLRRQLEPIFGTVHALAAMLTSNAPPQPLPVKRMDEVGNLIDGFNRLLERLAEREQISKSAQDALSESELRLRVLLQDLPSVAVQGYGVDWIIHYWNKASEQIYGYRADEAIGKSLLDLVVPKNLRNEFAAAMQQMIATGQPMAATELTLLRKDGASVEVFSSHVMVQVPGREKELFCIDVDLTARKQADAALRESEQRFRNLIEMSPDAKIVHCNGIIIYANPAAIKLYAATTPTDLIGKAVIDFIRPDFRPMVLSRMQFIADGGLATQLAEIKNLRCDGAEIDVEVQSVPTVFDGQAAIHVAIRDITARRQMEREVNIQRDFAAQIVTSMGQGLSVTDVNRVRLFANPALAKMLGFEVSDLIGQPGENIILPEDRVLQHKHVLQRVDGKISSYEVRLQHRDGSLVPVQITGVPRFVDGQYAGSIAVITDLTERKEMEHEVNVQRDFANQIISAMGMGLSVSSANRELVYVNPAMAEILREDADQLVGKFTDNFVVPDERGMQQKQQDLRRGGQASTYETHFQRSDGSIVPVQVSAVPRLIDGKYAGSIAVVTDLSARRQMEQEVKAQRDFAAQVIKAMGQGLSVVDIHGNLEYGNPAFAQLLGYELSEIIGQPVNEVISHDDHPLQMAIEQARKAGHTSTYETNLRHRDGSFVLVQITGAPRFVDGEYAGSIIVVTDLTERKLAEIQLQESEQRYRALVEWSPDPTIVQRNGTLIYVNPAFVKLVGGLSTESLLGTSLLDYIHPDSRSLVLTRMQSMRDGAKAAPPVEIKGLGLDGSVAHAEVRSIVIEFDGAPAVQILIRDITASKQAEMERASLEAQLRESQKMEAIGTLAGGVAHDFNNILAAILGNTELARQDVRSNPRAIESLDEINKAAKRARDLVQQILSFSRRQPTAKKSQPLAPIVNESSRLLSATLPARLVLSTECAPGLPDVAVDATQIQQVVMNLATNAMQAMPKGSGRIDICLDAVLLDAALVIKVPTLREMYMKHPGRVIRLVVQDSGPGMGADTRTRIFEPFFTTKPVDEGTGLGLSVVHGIVEGHDGIILVDSQMGVGTTFTIYLPVLGVDLDVAATAAGPAVEAATAAGPAVEAAAAAGPAAEPVAVEAKQTAILYIDDDESMVYLIDRMLTRRGYRVSVHSDQLKALAELRADPQAFDLVLSDYNMPGMSGLDVAFEVRAIRADLPVAIVTGFIDEYLRTQAESVGVRELLFKANINDEFCDAVSRLIAANSK